MRHELIAVIPARGGSKRIPHKNLVDFHGRPLLAWTIAAAQESGCFNRILVSTDDDAVAAVARQAGLEVPFLRKSAADDITPVSGATLVALEQATQYWGESYRTVVQLLPTCPLRKAEHIVEALTHFRQCAASFQISCTRFGSANPWWAVTLDKNFAPVPLFPDYRQARSQDLPELFAPVGAIWIADLAALQKAGTFYGPGHIYYPLEWAAAIDIDTPEDLELARGLAHVRRA